MNESPLERPVRVIERYLGNRIVATEVVRIVVESLLDDETNLAYVLANHKHTDVVGGPDCCVAALRRYWLGSEEQ